MDGQKPDTAQTQNPPINTMPTSAENKAPVSSSQDKEKQTINANKIYFVIAIFFLVLILGELGYFYIYHRSAFFTMFPSSFRSASPEQNSTLQSDNTLNGKIRTPLPSRIIVSPPAIAVYGSTDTECCKITVENVILNPPVVGDAPNKGLQYLEIDLSVTNTGKTAGAIPGSFYYQNATGEIFHSADVKGPGQYSNKNVTIPNKKSLYSVELIPGQTVKGVYLLYQITPGDKGKLEWIRAGNKQTLYPLFNKK